MDRAERASVTGGVGVSVALALAVALAGGRNARAVGGVADASIPWTGVGAPLAMFGGKPKTRKREGHEHNETNTK